MRVEIEAAAQGLTVDDYRLRRRAERAAEATNQAAREAELVARQDATRNRLIGEGVPEKTADAWIDAWRTHALRDRISYMDTGFWDAGWEWIAASRALRAEPAQWDHRNFYDDDGLPSCLVGLVVVTLTGILGTVLFVAFVLLGFPVWIPVVGTVAGVLGGFFLGFAVQFGLFRILDPIAYHSAWVDRNAAGVLFLAPAVGPPLLTLATTVLLLRLVQ